MKSTPNVGDVRVGVVGLGGMGRLHATSVRDLGARVVAGADVSSEARESFAETFDVRTYDDHESMIEEEPLDAVIVTTPNKFHEPISIAALEAGLDVLVEKPLAHTLESAERIADVASGANASCMVGFHNRHAASTAMLDAQKDEGRFGEITHVEARYVRRRGVPGAGSWFTDEDLAGGGALIDIGVHALDLALYVMDFPPIEEVTGVTRSNFGARPEAADTDGFGNRIVDEPSNYRVDDAASAFVRLSGGRTISLETAWATNRDPSSELIVRGTDAGARFDIGSTDLTLLAAGIDDGDHVTDVELTGDSSVTGYREQEAAFLEAVATGVTPDSGTVEEALTVQRVIDAIYRSSESGRAQRFAAVETTASSEGFEASLVDTATTRASHDR